MLYLHFYFKMRTLRDFPGGLVVKTLPPDAGDAGSMPCWKLKSHMPQGQKAKHKTESIL